MAQKLAGNLSGNVAEVDVNNNLKVNLPTAITQAGYASLVIENDDGTLFGSKKTRAPFVTLHRRIQVGLDTPLFDYNFNTTAQDTGAWKYITATMTTTWGTTGMLLNAISTLTATTGTAVSSYRNVTLTGDGSMVVDMTLNITDTPLANQVLEFGLFPFAAGNAAPTEGVYFRFSTAGLFGITNFNGTEVSTAQLASAGSLAANTSYVFTLRINAREVWFQKDGLLLANGILTTTSSLGQPFITSSLPVTFQFRNSGTVSGSPVMQAKIQNVTVEQKSVSLGKPYSHVQASKGQMGYQGQAGASMGSTALYSNSLAPGAGAVMTNTTAALGSGLGGQFSALPTLAANTDGIVSSFFVPSGGINQTPKTLYITGVKVQGAVTTVLAGNATPVVYAYSLAFGHVIVNLAATEGTATKSPRRVPLGYESYAAAAAVGTIGAGVNMWFDSPIVVNPGEFVQLVAKNVGVVTTTGVITFLVTLDCYWE